MAAKRKTKNTAKAPAGGNAWSAFAGGWGEKSPVLKYLGGFVLLLALFYALYVSPFFENWFLLPFLHVQTAMASFLLNLFGMGTTADGALLQGASISLNVAKGCDGMEASALFLIGVLLMPFSWRSKGAGLLMGAAVLFLLNLLRIVVLFLSKIYWPSAFEALHIHGGFALFTVVAILMWAGWAGWAIKKEKKEAHAAV